MNHSNSHFLSSLQFQMSPSQKASNRAIPWVHSEDRLLLHRVVVGGTPASSKDLHSLSICCTLLSGRRCTWTNILMVVMIMMMMVTARDEIGTGSIGRSCVTMQQKVETHLPQRFPLFLRFIGSVLLRWGAVTSRVEESRGSFRSFLLR